MKCSSFPRVSKIVEKFNETISIMAEMGEFASILMGYHSH